MYLTIRYKQVIFYLLLSNNISNIIQNKHTLLYSLIKSRQIQIDFFVESKTTNSVNCIFHITFEWGAVQKGFFKHVKTSILLLSQLEISRDIQFEPRRRH